MSTDVASANEGTLCDEAEGKVFALFTQREERARVFDVLGEIRECCPVHHSKTIDQWILTGYNDVKQALQDRSFAVQYADLMDVKRPDWRAHPALAGAADMMLMIDGAEHDRIRRIGLSKINVRLVQRKNDEIHETVDSILDPFLRKGGGEFMSEVAFPVTMTIISDLMGMPREDRNWYRQDVVDRIQAFDPSVTESELLLADEAAVRIRQFWMDIVALRQKDRADDLVSDLLNPSSNEEALTPEEIASFCDFLFGAGFDTTVNTLGLGLLAFLQNPREFEKLQGDPDLTQSMVEEILRYTTIIVGQSRVATEDLEVGGTKIPAGDLLFCALAGANRDPEEFRDPDRFDISRNGPAHMTFGFGRHMCLGAPLARAEIEAVFGAIATRVESIDLSVAESSLELEPRMSPRALKALPITVALSKSFL